MTEGNLEFAKNRKGNISYSVQNERYAFSGDFVYIFLARASIVSVILPFLQLLSAKEIGCQILPSWRPPGKSSSVGNASP